MPSATGSDSFTIAKILAPDTKERKTWTLSEEGGNMAPDSCCLWSRPATAVDFGGVLQCCDPESKQHRYCQHPATIVAVSEGSFMAGVTARLCQDDEWQKLHSTGCEMTITKVGRRMYPPFRLTNIRGLEENATYRLWLEFVQYGDDKYRYSYHGSTWVKAGLGERSRTVGARVYIHPDSPATGRHWMIQTVSFEKMKMTNCRDKAGMVPLSSMQKYMPLVHFEKVTSTYDTSETERLTFLFPQTSFMAVTAYQNQDITQIKINHNPFAKGFRDKENNRIGTGEERGPISHSCVSPFTRCAAVTETFLAAGSPFPVQRARAAARSSHPAGRRKSMSTSTGHVPRNASVLYPWLCPPGFSVYPPTPLPSGVWSLCGYPDCGFPGVGSPVSTAFLHCPWQSPIPPACSSKPVSHPVTDFRCLSGPLSWPTKGRLSGQNPSTETIRASEESFQQESGQGRSMASLTITLPSPQTPESKKPQRFSESIDSIRVAEGSRSSSPATATRRPVLDAPGSSDFACLFPSMLESSTTEACAERYTILPGETRRGRAEVLSSVGDPQSRSSSVSSGPSSPQSLSASLAEEDWSHGEHSSREAFHSDVPDESSKVWDTVAIHGRQSCTDLEGKVMAEPLLPHRLAVTPSKSIFQQHDAVSPCTTAVQIGYALHHVPSHCNSFVTSLIKTPETPRTFVSEHRIDASFGSSWPSPDFCRLPMHGGVNVSKAKATIFSFDTRLSGSDPTKSRSSTPKTDLPPGSSFPGDLSPLTLPSGANLFGRPESVQRYSQAAGTPDSPYSPGRANAFSPSPFASLPPRRSPEPAHYSPLECLSQMEKSFEAAWSSSQPKRPCWELPWVSTPFTGRFLGPDRGAAILSPAQIRLAKRQRLRLPRKWGGAHVPVESDVALDLSRHDPELVEARSSSQDRSRAL